MVYYFFTSRNPVRRMMTRAIDWFTVFLLAVEKIANKPTHQSNERVAPVKISHIYYNIFLFYQFLKEILCN